MQPQNFAKDKKMKYKDTQNKVHEIQDGFQHLMPNWPIGYTEITDEEAAILLAPPSKTPSELLAEIEQVITNHMDSVAQAKLYDNRDSCRLYAGYVNPFQAEAIAYGQWVASCWVVSNTAQAEIIAGTRTIPTPEEAVLELPLMVWPV